MTKAEIRELTSWLGKRSYKARLERFGLEQLQQIARENGHIDPTRHQKTWRTAWKSLTKAAGLNGFRFHHPRHQAVTELSEGGASDATIMAIAGHSPAG